MSSLGMRMTDICRVHPLRPRLSISHATHRYFGGIDIPTQIVACILRKFLYSMGILYPHHGNVVSRRICVHSGLDSAHCHILRKSLRNCRNLVIPLSSGRYIRMFCKLRIWSCLVGQTDPYRLHSIRHRFRWVFLNKVFRERFSLVLHPLVFQEFQCMFVRNIHNPQEIGHRSDGQVLVNDLDIVRSKQMFVLEYVAAWLLPVRIHPVSEVEAVVPHLRMRLYRSLRNEVR